MTRVEYIDTVRFCVANQYFEAKKKMERLKRRRERLFNLSMSAFDHERFMLACKFPTERKEVAE